MIRLQDILAEIILGEDRCKRIADRRYSKPSAYKSGAIVRCRKGKIWKRLKEEELDEAKQVGILYHYTNLYSLKNIIKSNSLLANEPDIEDYDYELDPYAGQRREMVSFSRSSPLNASFVIAQYSDAVLIIDGNRLSNNYKIYPTHLYGSGEDEMEERVYKDINNLNKYLIKVILFTSNPEIESLLEEKNIPYEIQLNTSWKDIKEDQINELGPNDMHYQNILNYFDEGNDDTKLSVLSAFNVKNRDKLIQALQDLGRKDALEIEQELGISLNEAKKETLRTWFKRKGAPGKTGGWVDCNTCREVDGKTKCKPCGRQKGEKRAKYPSCRPTPSACKQPGKGKKWGKTK